MLEMLKTMRTLRCWTEYILHYEIDGHESMGTKGERVSPLRKAEVGEGEA